MTTDLYQALTEARKETLAAMEGLSFYMEAADLDRRQGRPPAATESGSGSSSAGASASPSV